MSRRRWLAKAEMPESMAVIASSQMPPIESCRAAGLQRRYKSRAGNPAPILLTLVEPRRSADATKAPPVAAL